MAKVLLLSPSYIDIYGSLKNAAGRYFSFGIGYIASYLIKYGGHGIQLYELEVKVICESVLFGFKNNYGE